MSKEIIPKGSAFISEISRTVDSREEVISFLGDLGDTMRILDRPYALVHCSKKVWGMMSLVFKEYMVKVLISEKTIDDDDFDNAMAAIKNANLHYVDISGYGKVICINGVDESKVMGLIFSAPEVGDEDGRE